MSLQKLDYSTLRELADTKDAAEATPLLALAQHIGDMYALNSSLCNFISSQKEHREKLLMLLPAIETVPEFRNLAKEGRAFAMRSLEVSQAAKEALKPSTDYLSALHAMAAKTLADASKDG